MKTNSRNRLTDVTLNEDSSITLHTLHFSVKLSFKDDALGNPDDCLITVHYEIIKSTNHMTRYQVRKFLKNFVRAAITNAVKESEHDNSNQNSNT